MKLLSAVLLIAWHTIPTAISIRVPMDRARVSIRVPMDRVRTSTIVPMLRVLTSTMGAVRTDSVINRLLVVSMNRSLISRGGFLFEKKAKKKKLKK